MASTSAPAFPAVGDTYNSLADFKRDCYSYAVHHQARLGITQSSKDIDSHLRCPLNGTRTDERCSHAVACRVDNSADPPQYRVFQSEEEHDCGKYQKKVNRTRAVTMMQTRLDNVDNPPKPQAQRTRKVVDSGSDSDAGADDGNDDNEDEEKEQAGTGKKARATPDWAKLYPPAKELQAEITQMKESGIPSFPSSTERFSSPRSLLITLHAAANHRGFTLYRAQNTSNRRAVMHCSQNHSRFDASERCSCSLELVKDEDGRWSVGDAEYKHSHMVKDRDGREVQPEGKHKGGSSGESSKKRPKVEASPSNASDNTVSPSPELYAPSYTTQATSRYSYAPQQHSAAPTAQVRPIAPPPAIDYTFLPSLAHFLASITTVKSNLVAAAPSLIAHGFDSVEKLALLLSVSDEGLPRCVEDLGEVAKINKVQQVLLRKAVREARRKVGGGKSGMVNRAESREGSLMSRDGAAEVKNEPMQ